MAGYTDGAGNHLIISPKSWIVSSGLSLMERYFLKDHKTCLRRQGFTLLELLIVIAIIGILISIGVVSYGAAQKKSRDSRRMSDLKAVQAAFEQYSADN